VLGGQEPFKGASVRLAFYNVCQNTRVLDRECLFYYLNFGKSHMLFLSSASEYQYTLWIVGALGPVWARVV
jgi:hypothetical protein